MLILNMIIACALRCGVVSVEVYYTGHGLPFMGKTFHDQGVHWWTELTRGPKCEESRVVAL